MLRFSVRRKRKCTNLKCFSSLSQFLLFFRDIQKIAQFQEEKVIFAAQSESVLSDAFLSFPKKKKSILSAVVLKISFSQINKWQVSVLYRMHEVVICFVSLQVSQAKQNQVIIFNLQKS